MLRLLWGLLRLSGNCNEVLWVGMLSLGIRTEHRRVRCCLWIAIRASTSTRGAHRSTRHGVCLRVLLLLLLMLLLLLGFCDLRVC